jgi:hypothetical protein
LKLKAVQEGWGVAAYSWKRGGQERQRIERRWAGELLRLGYADDEHCPGQNRFDCLIRVAEINAAPALANRRTFSLIARSLCWNCSAYA